MNWKKFWQAIWYFLTGDSKVVPIPDPKKPKPDPPGPGYEENLIVADMLLIPDQMRQAGFEARDTALWYSLSRQIRTGDFGYEGDGELAALHERRGEMEAWWVKRVNEIIAQMRTNLLATATIIVNDGPDRCGQQLSLGTMQMFPDDLKPRVQLGETVPD